MRRGTPRVRIISSCSYVAFLSETTRTPEHLKRTCCFRPIPSEVPMSDRAAIRPASLPHAERLFDIRRSAILTLAPSGMPAQAVREWADVHELEWMHRVLAERRVWVFERGPGCIMGWVSVSGDLIDALYVDPACA